MIPTLSLSSLLNSDKSRFCCLHPIPCIWFITLPYKFFLKKKICCISSTGRGKAIYTITSPFDLISNSHSWQFFTDFQITQLGNKNQQVRNSESSSKYKFLPEMHSRNHFTCLTFGVCTAPVWWAVILLLRLLWDFLEQTGAWWFAGRKMLLLQTNSASV